MKISCARCWYLFERSQSLNQVMNIVTMNLHSTAKILFLVRLIRVRQLFFLQITFATKVKNSYGFSTWVPRNTTRKESWQTQGKNLHSVWKFQLRVMKKENQNCRHKQPIKLLLVSIETTTSVAASKINKLCCILNK